MKKYRLLLIIIIFPLAIAMAQEAELVRVKTEQGVVKIEANLKWQALALRGPLLYSGKNFQLSKSDLLQLIKKLVTEQDSLLKAENFTSLFLGRLVEFPWMQAFLMRRAAESQDWQPQLDKPNHQEINAWVAKILFKHPIWQRIDALFSNSGYHLSGLSVEKVLVDDVAKLGLDAVQDLNGKLPFDAQVWLILEKEKKNLQRKGKND